MKRAHNKNMKREIKTMTMTKTMTKTKIGAQSVPVGAKAMDAAVQRIRYEMDDTIARVHAILEDREYTALDCQGAEWQRWQYYERLGQ